MELQILTFNFLMYTLSGLWRPVHWTSKLSKLLYTMFTFVVVYLTMYTFLIHLMYLIFVVENVDQFASSAHIFFSLSNLLIKIITLITRRDEIINLIEILQGEPCKACDEKEINIEMKFDRKIRSYTMPYVIMCMFSALSAGTGGILYMLAGVIPYGTVWVPWNYSSKFVFFITGVQVIIAMMFGILINVASETTILGFCLQICARFEILKHRLQKMIKYCEKEGNLRNSLNGTSNKMSRLSEHVSLHLHIIRTAEMINDIFSQVIFVQFSSSILVLCTLAYHFSSHLTLLDVVSLNAYVFCMFVQIFYYCWSGNKVTLKSARFGEEVYNMDWVFLTSNEQKDLLMIMKRSTRPIKLSSNFLVTLSLESYSNILKASFSAFNLIQQL